MYKISPEKCPKCNTETEGKAMLRGVLFWCNNCNCQWEQGWNNIIE